ncbi:GntR family transcriptional regulator [Pseudonocardia sichuanensis]|uniref:DNA-binding GntR family transcriptional regulator n=1 Tax=Pseudonocardia kunmingensis TaxID=630975 RepID=A0A543D4P8_9PSEU|nr:GntR family transcriptional regulator [Pseudonocardia kunmingensis]TQM04309.1 DNA-binding GntR family transcriptional regulator [Pseudonocardia kunmingensis]
MSVPRALDRLEQGGQLAERTYEAVKSAILVNRLPPGTPLSVPELARQLGVSRSPVREAVQRLIYDGLATHAPNRGAEVSRVDIDDLRQLYLVREQLEGLAARLATEHLDADSLAGLREILAEHEAALATSSGEDILAHIDLDRRFHRTLRELAANPHLTAALEPMAGRSHFALHSLWRSPDAPRLALDEHRQIVEAMVAGDPELAAEAARRHIARLRTRLSQAKPLSPDPVGRRRRTNGPSVR